MDGLPEHSRKGMQCMLPVCPRVLSGHEWQGQGEQGGNNETTPPGFALVQRLQTIGCN